MADFVDIHSHVVPSGDDGVFTVAEGLELIEEAARRGTSRIYGTPHVWPIDGLSETRRQEVGEAFSEMRPAALELGVDLQLGYEVTPAEARLEEDVSRYRLGELDAVLIEVPFRRRVDLTAVISERVEAAGLVPIIAHPERSDGVLAEPELVGRFKDRGWLVQVNGSSLLGEHGTAEAELGWALISAGMVDVVASDGHRASRPPYLDEAHAAARDCLGMAADRLFDGSALTRLEPTLAGGDGVHLA